MRSSAGSTQPSRPDRIERVAVMLHARSGEVAGGLARLEAIATARGVELVLVPDEPAGPPPEVDLAVVLGGDGTMLRTLHRFLGTGVPVIGVNFGRVGFLSSVGRDGLEEGMDRALAGEVEVVELATIEVEAGEARFVGVNDVVVTSGTIGRMIELEWSVGGEDLGTVPCDGLICSTPSGSTAYNLSNGGPVLMWGLDAMALTFVAPHDLHARPFVVPRGRDVVSWNRTPGVTAAVLVDGHRVGVAEPGTCVTIRLGAERSLLATLPEATFVRRYRHSFL